MSVPSSSLSFIPRVSALSGRVLRVLGCNPGPMTLQGTNTYVVGSGSKRLLIDTGDGAQPEYFSNLRSALEEHGVRLSSVLLTHWHYDHVGGVAGVMGSAGADSGMIAAGGATLYKFPRPEAPEPELPEGLSYKYVNDGQVLEVEGATLRVLHTPGHTTDHVVLHLQEENALFSGDCILGEGTAVFEDLYDYMASLDKILQARPDVIYPAHGKVVEEPQAKIKYYIDHRNERERQILECLRSEKGRAMTAMDVVRIVYTQTPEALYPAAAKNVSHHLKKLLKEGSVEECGGGQENDGAKFRAKL